jgi:hypothetical protein
MNGSLELRNRHARGNHEHRADPETGLANPDESDALTANLGTLGVRGAPSRMSTKLGFRFVMNSGGTPTATARSRKCLRIA